jgi:hypothetical protein
MAAPVSMLDKLKENKEVVGFSVIGMGCLIASFVIEAGYIPSSDNNSSLRPQITKILILSIVATILFTIAIYIYFSKNEMMWVPVLIISCLSMGLSYSALAVAAISAHQLPYN